ncbi:MAG: hypothetical protein ACLRZH_06235 [Ruthenibacterium lactatiformans]
MLQPAAGDDIIGFITRGFGVSIHKRSCSNARGRPLATTRPLGERPLGGKREGELQISLEISAWTATA